MTGSFVRRPRARGAPLVLVAALLAIASSRAVAPSAASENDGATTLLPEAVCARLLQAFETLEADSLRAVLVETDVRIALADPRRGDRAGDPPAERRMSVQQAIVLLAEALDVTGGDRRGVEHLGAGALVAPRGTVACRRPAVGESGHDAFLVLHIGAAASGAPSRRLYLDLRREDAGWRVHAIRELP